MVGGRKRISLWKAVAYLILTALAIFWLMPFYIAIVTALKTHWETYATNVLAPPSHPTLDAVVEAWERVNRAFFNSIVISLPATFLAVAIGVMAGYYLSRFRFRGAQTLFFLIAIATFIPYQILLIPMTQLMAMFRLLNTHVGLIIAYALLYSPWAALISSAFFLTIPKELEEAAYIDGASPLQTFFRIVLPVALPGIISTTIIVFTSIWNEFLFALTLSMSPDVRPIQPEIANLRGTTTVAWNTVMAGAVIASIPPLIIFILLGRYFVRGLLAGALKF